MRSWAQNGEDLVLQVLLQGRTNGFYVDVGGYHPTEHSVTKHFYDSGWRGINVEPIPSRFQSFETERPRDINLNLGLAARAGTMTLREYDEAHAGWSSMSAHMHELHGASDASYVDYEVPVRTLAEILEEHGVEAIDFLKIDVEGFETEVILGNDWARWRPTIVVVERTGDSWHSLLETAGYREIFNDSLNSYFAGPEYRIPELVLAGIRRLVTEGATEQAIRQVVARPSDFIGGRDLLRGAFTAIGRRLRR
ncbi:MAG: FkbM family methyltransferase [Microbacteriaceae bacterium]|nr:FkbM family methyltransferase [Microbacteriaceae bacterium]